MMKSKPRILSLMVFLLSHQTSSTLANNINNSEVESFDVERRFGNYDLFTDYMKSGYTCTTGNEQVYQWCAKLQADHVGSRLCKCQCKNGFGSFVSPLKKCVDAMEAAKFGECKSYFEENNLLAQSVGYPVNLDQTATNTRTFSVTSAQSCSLSRNYFVHDYSGFHSRWKLNSDGFFTLNMEKNVRTFDIVWSKADTNGRLSGRIIRLHVTCTQGQSSSVRCILLKAKGTVIYSSSLVSSTTNTGHTSISNSPVTSHVSLLSATSSSVTKSSSLSLTVSPSSSLSQTSSASLPPSTTDRSSSTPSSSSSFPRQPPSASSSSSILSPSPSLVLTSSTGTLGVSQSDSSFLPLTQSQTARLPVITTGQIQATTSAVIVPLEPAETTTTVSSSSAADGGPGNRGTQTGGNDNGVVIGAAVGGAVVLGILVIIFIVFWKRRKAWESSKNEIKPVKNPVYGSSENAIQLEAPKGGKTMPSIAQGNQPTYQSLIDDNGKSKEAAIYSSADDEYDNCTVYQSLDKQIPRTPVYGRLNKGLPEPAHTTGLPKPKPKAKTSVAGIPTSDAIGVTGLPKPKPTTTGQPSNRPIVAHENAYNVLDGPGTGQGTTPEPMYNVLEGTDSGQDYEAPTVDPLYNVLEVPDPRQDIPKNGPSTKQDPLYNVLEGPDAKNAPINSHDPCNDPLYNVLEGPEASHDAYESGARTTQEPLYNVLDGPDAEKSLLVTQDTAGPSNEPLYNVLDGPDSDGSKQGAPKEPISPEAHDNPAYEQTLAFDAPYAAVHSPGMQRESVYEPLRGPGQDLYESIG